MLGSSQQMLTLLLLLLLFDLSISLEQQWSLSRNSPGGSWRTCDKLNMTNIRM